MGCLNISITRKNESVIVDVSRIGNGIVGFVTRLGDELKLLLDDATNHLKVKCSIVCSLGEFRYLNISPDEVQWITDDRGVFFDVESNVEWIIITD